VVASAEQGLVPADGAVVVGDGVEEFGEGHGLLSCVPLFYSLTRAPAGG
jgi:hypothetical protein